MVRKSPPRTPRPPGPPQRLPAGTRKSSPATQRSSRDGPPSIRIKITGRHTTAQLRRILHEAVDGIEAQGILHIDGGNIYANPVDEAGKPLTAQTAYIEIKSPYPCAADKYKAP
jgi:hypothetical protein